MADKPMINILGQNLANPEDEEQYYKWYHEGHIPEFFKFKGMKSAARYKRIGDDETVPQYLTIYTFDSLEARKEYEQSPERAAGMKATGRPDGITASWRGQFELIRSWEK